MKENWRPKEGWAHKRSVYFEQNQPPSPYYKTRQKDYEAGADAMLVALVSWLVEKDLPNIVSTLSALRVDIEIMEELLNEKLEE